MPGWCCCSVTASSTTGAWRSACGTSPCAWSTTSPAPSSAWCTSCCRSWCCPSTAAMRAIDTDYVKAAANLGATPAQAFWHVFLPLSLPGLFAGSLIVFVLCLGFFVTPAILGGGKVIMVSMQIASQHRTVLQLGRGERARRRASGRHLRRAHCRLQGRAPRPGHRWRTRRMGWLRRPASETQVTHGRRLWLYAFAALVMLFLVAPTIIVDPHVLLAVAISRVSTARMVAALVRALSVLPGLDDGHRDFVQGRQLSPRWSQLPSAHWLPTASMPRA